MARPKKLWLGPGPKPERQAKLSQMQDAFARAYSVIGDPSRAYRASFTAKRMCDASVRSAASKLMRKPVIRQRIEELMHTPHAAGREKLIVNTDVALQKLAMVAFSDVSDYLRWGSVCVPRYTGKGSPVTDAKGRHLTEQVHYLDPVPLVRLTARQRAAIESVGIVEGDDGATVIRLVLLSKVRAFKALVDYLVQVENAHLMVLDNPNPLPITASQNEFASGMAAHGDQAKAYAAAFGGDGDGGRKLASNSTIMAHSARLIVEAAAEADDRLNINAATVIRALAEIAHLDVSSLMTWGRRTVPVISPKSGKQVLRAGTPVTDEVDFLEVMPSAKLTKAQRAAISNVEMLLGKDGAQTLRLSLVCRLTCSELMLKLSRASTHARSAFVGSKKRSQTLDAAELASAVEKFKQIRSQGTAA